MKKVAVVTGAAGGLGQAISTALQQDGLHVVGLDIDTVRLNNLQSAQFTGITCDLTKPDNICDAFDQIAKTHGGVDVLVNNAGTCFMSDFPNIPVREFEQQMSVNFGSAFHCAQAAVKLMKRCKGVRKIVNISSNGAYNFDVFDPPHYRASKAAMDTLTKDLARRYARDQIAVNSIAPAMTETPLFDVLSQDVLDAAIDQMPHGHPMQPKDVAAWVRFLVSSAGDICSGNVIILNQGRDVR